MHRAPATRVALRDPLDWLAWIATAWGPALLATLAWLAFAGGAPQATILGLLVFVLSILLAARSAGRIATGHLAWSEGRWCWQRGSLHCDGQAILRLDGGSSALIEFRPAGNAGESFWMLASGKGESWLDARRALIDGRGDRADEP